MGAPQAGADPDLDSNRNAAATHTAAAVLDFAATQILRTPAAVDAVDALPAVLARMATAFGLRAALAFQPGSPEPTVLAAYPRNASPRNANHRDAGMDDGDVLVTYSPPVAGRCLCALALIGDGTRWNEEVQATAHAVAVLVAAKIRHTSELAKLDDQTERLNCLIAAAIPGVLIIDEQGLITHVSQNFGTLFGIEKPGHLVGTPAIATLRRIEREFADPVDFVRRTVAMFRARHPVSGDQILAADGRTLECDYWPVLVDGHYRGDMCLLWDMSDRTALARQREEQNFRLRELDEARNQFVAMVSHELRTPLTSIVSFSELIRSEAGGLTADGLHFLDIIERNAGRLLRLVGDLLTLSKLEAGVLPLDLAPVSVPELVTEAVRTASAVAASQGIRIDVTTGTGPPVLGDSRRLLQVLDNLIGNAVKFSHQHGSVGVTATCDDGAWRIDVTDDGIGIPPDEAARLFGRFVRASNARTAGLPGTGLGLSIVKAIIDMHGGHVEVDTVLHRGTTFGVYLPAVL